MTSFATRRALSDGRSRGGFTLLEILLSIAIVALLAAVLIGGSAALLNEQPLSLDEVFWRTVQVARKEALTSEREIRVKFDVQKKQFTLLEGLAPSAAGPDGIIPEEIPVKQIPVPAGNATELAIDFLGAGKAGNSILVGGVLLESQPIPFVTFYSDGTCTPFRVQVSRNGAVHTMAVDPWTCAPVLETKEGP